MGRYSSTTSPFPHRTSLNGPAPTATIQGRPVLERELIKDGQGNLLGEIREEDGTYMVWKREKPSFPPKSRHKLLGTAGDIEEARRLAEQLRR